MGLKKMWLKLNGVNRMVICDPENETLSSFLRKMGCTSVKEGCKIGVCGACNVIVNDKLIRSCTRKMKTIPEWSNIITLEGIGSASHLHPLQWAFMTCGSVQCGFCIPGFIVSSFALLAENPNPTREDVRDWFHKNRNACRCTGYKQIVDAVMVAASVMRGELALRAVEYDYTREEKDIYGSSYPRPTALSKVCGVAEYGGDVKLRMPENTLHMALVQTKSSHAKILSIDFSEALAVPGVVDVMTAKDIKGTNSFGMVLAHPRDRGEGATEIPVIADQKIYRRGDVVAVVLADSEKIAWEAVAKVEVELEQLPEYMNYLDAVAPNAIRIHDNKPNMHLVQPVFKGEDATTVIDNSEVVVQGSFRSPREPHLPIEPETLLGYWGDDGMLTIQNKSHHIYGNLRAMSMAIGIQPEKVRIIANTVGGSFGYAIDAGSSALVGAAVMKSGRPVMLSMPYDVHQHYTGKRSVAYSNARLGATKDGKITGAEFEFGVDHGPFANICMSITGVFVRFPFFGYYIPSVRGLVRMGSTNHAFSTAYRGYGCPQSYTCSESMMDMMAEKLGMDPFEFRYLNVATEGDTNLNSIPYKEYPMRELMDAMRPYYKDAKEDAAMKSTPQKKRGVGVSIGGYNTGLGFFDQAEVRIEMNADGMFTIYNTWEDIGQGGDIGTFTHAVKALKPMGISPEQIRLNINDSFLCPDSGIAAGSRSHFMVGGAMIDAAEKLMNAARKPDGTYRTHAEMKEEALPTSYTGLFSVANTGLSPLDPNTGIGDTHPAYMYSVYVAEVEVDMESGKTRVLSIRAAVDVGVIGNILAVEGQAYGGLSHCVGYALSEEYEDIEKHTNILASGITYCNDMPDDIKIIYVENPRAAGPYGSAGCSENFQSAGHMAIINAIHDAAGVRIFDLPARKEKVKAAIDKLKENGLQKQPRRFFLGSDFMDEMDDIVHDPKEAPKPMGGPGFGH